jgi:adenine-specific DNA-methyltransferase
MAKLQKLELTWYGKENEKKIEPRILIEDLSKSNIVYEQNTDNIIIHGDNLLALKALENEYAGKIKCIYIDPPYNTGSAFEHYPDNLEHSLWLDLMQPRLELLRKLLSEDGSIFVQIDDNEMAYLTVLLDEIFGRSNRINTICVNMSNLSGVKINSAINGKRFPKIKEYILIYVKNKDKYVFSIPKQSKQKWDSEYNLIIPEMKKEDYNEIQQKGLASIEDKIKNFTLKTLKDFFKENRISETDEWKNENSYRIVGSKPNTALLNIASQMNFNKIMAVITSPQGLKKLIKTDFNRTTKTARIELVFAAENQEVFLGDHWSDIVTTGGVGQEGGGNFPNGKKPEKLIKRIIETATSEGDLVLDSFLGSGTTAAVAHKMQRKWIGIEMGDHAYTHCKVRLDNVINGSDQSGISKAVDWKGGGGYRFYELAPTLIKKDSFGQHVINPEYNPEMLASAVAKHEGYVFSPHENIYWKQAKTNENSYLFVTTRHMSRELMESISQSMSEGEFLLVVCRSFDATAEKSFKNIRLKKIPQSLLRNCEFDVENYNLNIVNPPIYQEDVMEDDLLTDGGDEK